MAPPVIVLGVGRSGRTLLRVMLDRNSEIAIPYESFFVTPLAQRHGRRPNLDDFLDDLGRFYQLYEWGISPEDVRPRLREGMTTGEAITAVFEVYAEHEGKPRWGDKTPLYMQHLPLLERLFPDALWVHLVRDGRDAALSFLSLPEGFSEKTWAMPHTAAQFAARWRTEILAARQLGAHVGGRYLELRYEDLVTEPERELRRVCEHTSLPWEPAMLDYPGTSDVASMPEHKNLAQPPDTGATRLAQPDEPRGRAGLRGGRGRRPAQRALRAARAWRELSHRARQARARALRRAQPKLEPEPRRRTSVHRSGGAHIPCSAEPRR